MTRTLAETLEGRLEELRAADRLRDPGEGLRERAARGAAQCGERLLDASSNNYLGLCALPVSRETSGGAGASRLIHGTRPEHVSLEALLADWMGCEAALLFASGYAANVGTLSALVAPGDRVISDSLNHASIIDGCQLAKGTTRVVPHADLGSVGAVLAEPWAGATWVVVESYYSMEGDSPDLPGLAALCQRYGAFLIVDEAHALGVFGSEGEGLSRAQGVHPDVTIGTLGKAMGLHGAFVAGSCRLRWLLWNRARSFVFSTATSPALAAAAEVRLRQVRQDEVLRERLQENAENLEQRLLALHVKLSSTRHGPIFPIVLRDPARARQAAGRLAAAGILTQAVRPPTVPEGTSRLRITVSAGMHTGDVARLARGVAAAIHQEG